MYTIYSYFLEAATRGVLYKKAVHKNLALFTGMHLCWALFIKNRLQHRCFAVINAKFLRTPILKDICKRPAVLILRRYFGSSSLSVFCKIGILKALRNYQENTYAEVSFQYSCRPLARNYIKLKNASWLFFNESCKIFILRTHLLRDSFG